MADGPPRGLRFDRLDSILCVGAHADDIEIGCAGTIARLLARHPNLRVHWVVLAASGDRSAEADASARRLLGESLASIEVLDFTERYLPYDPLVKRFFDRLGGQLEPDLVLCPRTRDLHQDHRVAAELTWNTFRTQPVCEYEIVKYEGDLSTPNLYVPLSAEQVEAKVAHLLSCFPSQAGRYWFSAETFRSLARIRGVEARAPGGYAEAFHARKLLWV